MRVLRLHLEAFGPFTDRTLEFGATGRGLVLVHGPNEAGKSSALRAISDLRFGIPHNSSDNFIHPHPEMRIGGVFVDRQGREYALTRRKGRGATLQFAKTSSGRAHGARSEGAPGDEVVSPEVEALLCCGLSREEYELSFGIDHDRLRKGGEALRKGEGETGAALFEASAGVYSVKQVLERLEQSARKFYIPGGRARNGLINEGLRAYDEHHGAYRKALVRPAYWNELFRKHESATQELSGLERRRAELTRKQLLIGELRAVAPLLAGLDRAAQSLHSLQDVTLLPPGASADRAAAVSGLAAARAGIETATTEVERQQHRLGTLTLDAAILEVGPAVGRLAASVDIVERLRGEIADARAELAIGSDRVQRLAARIDATLAASDIASRTPPAARAGIEHSLRQLENADQALEQHREALARQARQDRHDGGPELPPVPARTALRVAQTEVARCDTVVKRLSTLPPEIEAARRRLSAALDALGLSDEAASRRVRRLLDSQIDEAMSRQRHTAAQRAEQDERIKAIGQRLVEETAKRHRLLEQGAVPTADDVRAARQHRDENWARVRARYVDRAPSAAETAAGGTELLELYEGAVKTADRLADELARDSERAAQLQAHDHAIAGLERERCECEQTLEQMARIAAEQDRDWQSSLAAARLPSLSPPELREWQALLPEAHQAAERLQALLDEQEQGNALARTLAASLREAIIATGIAAIAPDAELATLCATADEIEQEIAQRQKQLDTAAGKRLQAEQHRREMLALEMRLEAAAADARKSLAPALERLLLAPDASIAVARARLGEFDELAEACEALASAQAKLHRAQQSLGVHEEAARKLASALGDPEPPDARLYAEHLAARLLAAERVRSDRTVAEQALRSALDDRQRHEEAATIHEEILAGLCRAAGLSSPALLPEAEERSQRKREALAESDRTREQLAQASRRQIEELRTLLEDRDQTSMETEEAELATEQAQLEDLLQAARLSEESARRVLGEIDGSDTAAAEREAMEQAAARVRSSMSPWIRSRLAQALLAEALKRFRERAQGPMLESASKHFERMTAGEFLRLSSDDSETKPVLLAYRRDGSLVGVEALSEGTRDQLYLALRLAALELRRSAGVDLPVVLDDVLMTSDDQRAALILQSLADFSEGGQVIVFTHHHHVAELAMRAVPGERLAIVRL
jgi:exonuclease SbcC